MAATGELGFAGARMISYGPLIQAKQGSFHTAAFASYTAPRYTLPPGLLMWEALRGWGSSDWPSTHASSSNARSMEWGDVFGGWNYTHFLRPLDPFYFASHVWGKPLYWLQCGCFLPFVS